MSAWPNPPAGGATHRTQLGREVRVFPNVIEIWQDGEKLAGFTPEEWGEMVQFVGITGVRDDTPVAATRFSA